jgi:hypothetical protein
MGAMAKRKIGPFVLDSLPRPRHMLFLGFLTNIFISNLTVTDLKRNAIFLFLVCVCARASFIGISVSYQTNGACGGGSKEARERGINFFFRSLFLLS